MGGLSTLCRILEPLRLGYFMVSLLSVGPQHNYHLYGCPLVMFINAIIRYRGDLIGIRISSALKGLVYLKVSHSI